MSTTDLKLIKEIIDETICRISDVDASKPATIQDLHDHVKRLKVASDMIENA